MSNNFDALPGQLLNLRKLPLPTTFLPLIPGLGDRVPHLLPPRDTPLLGWVPSCRDGYDTMVILRLLFTSRKSRQSRSFSLPRQAQ